MLNYGSDRRLSYLISDIKGNFFKSVLSKTLPIGISLYLNVILVYAFKDVLGLSDPQLTTMAMMAMTTRSSIRVNADFLNCVKRKTEFILFII